MLRGVFGRYGVVVGNGVQYTGYLGFLLPYGSAVLREVLTNKVRHYAEMDKMQRNCRPS